MEVRTFVGHFEWFKASEFEYSCCTLRREYVLGGYMRERDLQPLQKAEKDRFRFEHGGWGEDTRCRGLYQVHSFISSRD